MSVICRNTGNRQKIECLNCDCGLVVYLHTLTPTAKTMTWNEWKAAGGCGLSMLADGELLRSGVLEKPLHIQNPPLGDIARGSVLAEREIARFGTMNLGMDNWSVREAI